MTGNSLGIRLARFILILGIGMIFTRGILMPVTRKLASKKVQSIATQASIENITGLASGIVFFSLALEVSGYSGLVTVITTVTAALTVAIGFGMREEVGSLVSGFFIQVDRPFIKGDYIEVGETRGVVKEIKLRSTILKTSESDKVVLPNRVITSAPMNNYTKGKNTCTSVEIKVPVKKTEKALEVLLESADSIDFVLDKPEPSVSIDRIEEAKAVVQLECYVKASRKVEETRSEILENFSGRKEVKQIYEEEKK